MTIPEGLTDIVDPVIWIADIDVNRTAAVRGNCEAFRDRLGTVVELQIPLRLCNALIC